MYYKSGLAFEWAFLAILTLFLLKLGNLFFVNLNR